MNKKTIELKSQKVQEIKKAFSSSQTLVVAKYHGVNANSMNELRKSAQSKGVYLHVLKNNLVKRALEGTSFDILATELKGPLIYSASEDPLAAAQLIYQLSKTTESAAIVAGSYNNKLLSADEVKLLANTPNREQSLAMIAGVFNSIIAKFMLTVKALEEKSSTESVS